MERPFHFYSSRRFRFQIISKDRFREFAKIALTAMVLSVWMLSKNDLNWRGSCRQARNRVSESAKMLAEAAAYSRGGCFALTSLPVSQSRHTMVPFAGYVQTVLESCLFLS